MVVPAVVVTATQDRVRDSSSLRGTGGERRRYAADHSTPGEMRVIGTVGLPGSGKGEFAEVARDRGIPVVTMGDVVRRACRDRGLDPAEHHGEVARALREEEGPLAIAERSLPMIRDRLEANEVVVVDGLRSGEEAERFEAAFGESFLLVAITAPAEVRAERLDLRGRDDTDTESIEERDERELGFGMGEAIDRADLTVENAGSLEAFRERAAAVLDYGTDGTDLGGVERP
jgi:dephospho-CoA kinase